MADRLDDMLEPGERVVYRSDTFRTALRVFFASLAGIAVCWGIFLAFSGVEFGMAVRGINILLVVVFAVSFGFWFQTGAAIVTGHRLLYDHGPWATVWGRQRLIAVPLNEIAELTGMKPSWRQTPSLRLTDKRVIGLGNIPNPKRLAEALAIAPSDAPTYAPTRIEAKARTSRRDELLEPGERRAAIGRRIAVLSMLDFSKIPI